MFFDVMGFNRGVHRYFMGDFSKSLGLFFGIHGFCETNFCLIGQVLYFCYVLGLFGFFMHFLEISKLFLKYSLRF